MRRTGEEKACEQCGRVKHVAAYQLRTGEGRYCSRACKHQAQKGHPQKSGGYYRRQRPDGYIECGLAFGQSKLEHRLVMEQALGRKLETFEHVHHLNGEKADNRLENLRLVSNPTHWHIHGPRPSRRITLICHICGKKYQRIPAKVAESSTCSRACAVKKMHMAIAKSRETYTWGKHCLKRPKSGKI